MGAQPPTQAPSTTLIEKGTTLLRTADHRIRRAGLAIASAAALASLGLAGPAGAAPAVPHQLTTRPAASPATSSLLAYGGGNVVTNPSIYIVYWGSQWGTGSTVTNDPAGEAPLQLSFFQHAYGSGDTWSNSVTQYCQGVATGTTQCGTSGVHVGHPASNPVAGTWLDSGVTAPKRPGSSAIAAEAQRAAAHFGVSGDNVQIIVDVPHGVVPQGFKTSYCAWHDHTTASNGGDLPYTNMPYVSDAGSGCGANFVATGGSGVNGATEGVTIVGGHEYAETVTDPAPSSGWLDASGAENGDKCAWISSGQGASTVVSMNGAQFAVQSLWSNDFNNGSGGCVNSYVNAGNQG